MKRHCAIINKNGNIYIVPTQDSKLFVNGLNVGDKKQIYHLDRITLGNANTFKLIIPGKKSHVKQ
jgi:predicted component of type VI protein secretion system